MASIEGRVDERVEGRVASDDPAAATYPPRSAALNAWSLRVTQAHGMLLGAEVFRSLRHGLFNRLTGLGAVAYQLRRKVEQLVDPNLGDDVRGLLSDLSRQIASTGQSLDRRLPDAIPSGSPCDVCGVAENLVAAFVPPDRVSFERQSEPVLCAEVDEMELAVALLCLMENALEAMGSTRGGEISLRCPRRADGNVAIEICDSGTGLTSTAADMAFDRFFTTKPGHLGLGLAVAKNVAMRWNATLELTNRTDGRPGARATLSLPPRRQ